MDIILLFLADLLFGIMITWLFELILKSNKKLKDRYYRRHKIFFGYHIHHSIYGILAIIASVVLFFINEKSAFLFWLAFGIGIIVMHTISSGRFIFIEKQKS